MNPEKILQMKRIFLNLFILLAAGMTQAQVATNGGSGLAGTYPNLADAITALNAATINSPVIITVTANQTAPAGGYSITAEGTAANSITLIGKGASITASAAQAAGSLTDAIFKLVGADYVTIKDFTLQENAANTTTDEGTNNMTEWAVAVLTASVTNGAQNNTIQNNAISLNKTYQNSFGIYASTAHSSSNAIAGADITAATGGNDNLKIYSNTISNVNIPVAVVGSPAFPGLGLDMGGTSLATGNTLTDWGTTSFYAAFARFDNLINYTNGTTFSRYTPGILAVNQLGPNISHNSITSNTAGVADNAIVGIYAPTNGAITYPGTAFTTNINANKLSLYSNVFGANAAVPLIYGIRVHTGDAVSTLHIDTTEFLGVNHITAGSPGADTLIYSFAQVKHLTMNANKFQNLQIGHTGGLAFMAIQGRVFMPVDGTQNLKNNVISGLQRSSTGAVGSTVGITRGVIASPVATDGSEAGSSFTAENNSFANINTNGGGFSGVVNFDGKQGTATLSKNISGNTFSGIDTRFSTSTVTTGAGVTLVNFTSRGGMHTVSNNLMENIRTDNPLTFGFITGITNTGFFTGMSYSITGNIMRNWDGAQLQGINLVGPGTVSNNQFYGWNGRVTIGTGNTPINMNGLPAGTILNITQNKIGNITNPITGIINAINVGALANITATVNIYNNLIGDLKTPVASNFNAITGINIAGGSLLVADVAYNTVYLNASSSANTFGTSCVLFNGATPAPTLKLRNNVLINLSTPAQDEANNSANGVSAVLRRSIAGTIGVAPSNYDIVSNNNLLYVNPTAGTNNHLTYVEGGIQPSSPTIPPAPTAMSNAQNTLAQMQAFMVNRDQASVTPANSNNPFASLVAADDAFLHINLGINYETHNAGVAIAGITTDFDGDTRDASTPDIGADEYVQGALPVSISTLNGNKAGHDNILSWTTSTEASNRGFDVERSANGVQFTRIGFVASKATNGNSNHRIDYSFTDRNVAAGKFYYRLVQTDLDGRTKTSNVVLINDKAASQAGISSIHPNPARSVVTLTLSATKNGNAYIAVTDATGKLMHKQVAPVAAGSNIVNMNVDKFASGVYFVAVQMSQADQPVIARFIKN
jgi:hypothetical protein